MGMTAMLRRNAQVRANDIALVFEDRQMTWSELLDRATRLAAVYTDLSVRPGDRIALLMANSDRFFEAIYAAAWAGAIAVPMNIRLNPQELADNLDDCAPSLLVSEPSQRHLADAIGAHGFPLLEVSQNMADPRWQNAEKLIVAATPLADADRDGDDPFAIFYTGGTTGRSKGVVLSHRNFISCGFTTLAEGFTPGDGVYLNVMPTFHLSNMWPAVTALISGAKTICQPGFVVEDMLAAVERYRVTDMLIVPTMVQMLVEFGQRDRYDTSSLSRVIYGAAPITEALLARALEAFPATAFSQGYGMTELSPLTTLLPASLHHRADLRRSAGRAVMGVEVRIVDKDDVELPRGQYGELIARGDNMMKEYWNRPEESASALRNGWMHTGDAGHMDEDGFIFISDRIKDMIITGGENVYSIEVENILSLHPAVHQCAVVGLPDEKWGERVHAVVNLREGMKASPGDLIAFVKERFAHYKCPRSIDIRSEPLPLSNVGKVMKRVLRDECARKAQGSRSS